MRHEDKGLNEFLEALFEREAGGNHQVENRYGYIGKYQFGEDALVDTGYYRPDGSLNRIHGRFKYDWVGSWTGKNGATSKEIFLSSPEIQDHAAKDWVALLCKRLHANKLAHHIGKRMAGTEITESGIIAAAHLKGFGNARHPGVIAFLRSNGAADATDANGTPISTYMRRFAGYSLGCYAQCALQVLDSDNASVAGLRFKLMAKGKEIHRGRTDDRGQSSFMQGFAPGDELSVLVQRLEGGDKEVARFLAGRTPTIVTLTSPKVMLDASLLAHAGPAGPHAPHEVRQVRERRRTGHPPDRATGVQRNVHGNPVHVAKPPAPLPPIADRIGTLQEVLRRNVNQGSKGEALSGPAAAMRARKGEAISEIQKGKGESLGRCYQYVKIALKASDMTRKYLAGEHAKDAGPELAKEGFQNLLACDGHGLIGPLDAPLGAVIVYGTTDGSPHGHIEVRIADESGHAAVASDYMSPRPRTQVPNGPKTMQGRGREVIGIWVKAPC